MPFITTTDETEIFYKNWGNQGRPGPHVPPWLAAQLERLGHVDKG